MKKFKLKLNENQIRAYIWVLIFFIAGLLIGGLLLGSGNTGGVILVPHPQFTFQPEERYSVSDNDCREQAIAKGYESKGLTCALLYVKSDSCRGYDDTSYCCIDSAICNCYYIKS